MLVRKEEGLLAPKTVIKSLGVAGTVAAVAILVSAIAGGPARADNAIPIRGDPKILSEADLDQVYAGFMKNGPDLYDESGFYYNYIGNYKIGDKTYPAFASSLAPENRYIYVENSDTLISVAPVTGLITVLINDTLNSRIYDQRGVEISGLNVPFLPSFPR